MKLTPTQAKALDAAIAFYLDRDTSGEYDLLLMDIQRDVAFQTLVKQATSP